MIKKQKPIYEKPHRRLNLLTNEWILVSPQRMKRPWRGKVEEPNLTSLPNYHEDCYLCPGNKRANGEINPIYKKTHVFTNDFLALLPDTEEFYEDGKVIRAESVKGTCRVICFSPRHDITMAEMKLEEIQKVINVWVEQLKELGKEYEWVQIFENKGEIMGCSNSHPHGQIWAINTLPNEIKKEDVHQMDYFNANESILLLDYLNEELTKKERVLVENDEWVSLVPYWAEWPFETMILPKRHILQLDEINEKEKISLAALFKVHLTKYDNLFKTSFPYTMGWHGAPYNSNDNDHWQLHLHFYPPLLRSASVKKFMVGYELLAESQRDITPEQAAIQLRELPNIHFKEN